MKHFNRMLALILALVLTLSCVGMAAAAETVFVPTQDQKSDEAQTEQTLSDEALHALRRENAAKSFKKVELRSDFKGYKDEDVVRAIVVLEGAPAAEQAKGRMRASSVSQLASQHRAVTELMSDVDYTMQYDFTTLVNGMSIDVAYGDLDKVAQLPGVKNVYLANYYEVPTLLPPTDGSSEQTGIMGMWDSGYNGEGKVIAVLDTGLAVNHEAFRVHEDLLGDEVLTEEDLSRAKRQGVYVSEKIPFAYDYGDKDQDVTDIRNHGTHVAGIAAGCTVTDEGAVTFTGAAPAAQILAMKIFRDYVEGTSSDIYFAALEDAYLLGADVINMSIGAQNGFTYDAGLEGVLGEVYRLLEESGVVVCAAAGNETSQAQGGSTHAGQGYVKADYADYGTVGAPSTYVRNESVASVDSLRYPADSVAVGQENFLYTDGRNTWKSTLGGGEYAYEMIPGLGTAQDFAGLDLEGKIAVIQRGDLSFQDKVDNAEAVGAVGVIVYDNVDGPLNMQMQLAPGSLPAIFVTAGSGRILAAAEPKVLRVPAEKEVVEDTANAGKISIFSGWGTTPDLKLKPTITSVGGNVYSAVPGAEDSYDVYGGTSMATPNMAGGYAALLQALDELGIADKAVRMELARDLMQSSARILLDENMVEYAPRRQGAGISDVAQALETYKNGAYLETPLVELGDDPDRTGVYKMELTLVNESDKAVTYRPEAVVLRDKVMEQDGVKYNTLKPETMKAKVTFDCGAKVTVPANGEKTVTVTVALDKKEKARLDADFENGGFVEGYVTFTATPDGNNGKHKGNQKNKKNQEALALGEVHATFMGFYGDWTQAPVLEEYDFRDVAPVVYELGTTCPEGSEQTYADLGYTYKSVLNMNTDANLAFQYDTWSHDITAFGGDNMLGYAEYMPEHTAFSTYATDGDFYANGLLIIPMQLRNAESLKMTVFNKEDPSKIYREVELLYAPKAAYDYNYKEWQSYTLFSWDGTDQTPYNYVPSGTVATVQFDAILPYNHTKVKNAWSFDVMVDYKKPVIEDYSYDAERQILTVTASDENYLQAIYVGDYYGNILDAATVSSDVKGDRFTVELDVSKCETVTANIGALDYATNESYVANIPVGEVGVPATVTYHTAGGDVVEEVKTGDTFRLSYKAEDFDNAKFSCWTDRPYVQLSDPALADMTYSENQEFQITGDMEFYALYAVCDVKPYDPVAFDFILDPPMDKIWEGEFAICGNGMDLKTWNLLAEEPYALGKDVQTINLEENPDDGYWQDEDYDRMFYTNKAEIRWISEYLEDEDCYTLKNYVTGKYLTGNPETLELTTTDTVEEGSKWNLKFNRNGISHMKMALHAAPNVKLLFVFAEECGREVGLQLFDDSKQIDVTYPGFLDLKEPMQRTPSDYYMSWMYYCLTEELTPGYYTTNP